ncbi:uncharacterized protein LOC130710638 [Lotus japonicus]|uniref:uncharacterized protein LOC130710638 n=1 Tax=Lotus japonicus TaxID=34305 RepID=UPI002583D973|nr:uncharacterized protein LOC130710638 [Lotus japonicus]
MMFHMIKNLRTHAWLPRSLFSNLGRGSTSPLRFCTHSHNTLDKTQKPSEKSAEDVNSSAGGYAQRSDEKGFEGGNGGNNAKSKIEMDKFIHENHPAYDKTQVNESKEKKNTRH